MSCYKPISLRNNSTHYHYEVDKFRHDVPCGKCFDCQKRISNDWYVRLKAEIDDTLEHGGSVCFVTLTYSDEFLPFIPGTNVPAFDSYHIDRFLHRLRDYLRDYSLYPLTDVDKKLKVKDKRQKFGLQNIRYYIGAEYGDTTHRPHYHAVLFFPFERNRRLYSFSLFNRKKHDVWFSADFLFNLIQKYWKYGKVRIGEDGIQPPELALFLNNSNAASEYVAKYSSKEMDQFAHEEYNAWVSGVDYETGELDPIYGRARLNAFSRYKMRTYASQGLGRKIIEMYICSDEPVQFLKKGYQDFANPDILRPYPKYLVDKADTSELIPQEQRRYRKYEVFRRFPSQVPSPIANNWSNYDGCDYDGSEDMLYPSVNRAYGREYNDDGTVTILESTIDNTPRIVYDRKISDRAVQIKKELAKHNTYYLKNQLEIFTRYTYLKSSGYVEEDTLGLNMSLADISTLFINSLGERSVEDLALYKLYFQDRDSCHAPLINKDNIWQISEQYIENFYKVERFGSRNTIYDVYGDAVPTRRSRYIFNHDDYFAGFDSLLEIVQKVRNNRKYRERLDARIKTLERRKRKNKY